MKKITITLCLTLALTLISVSAFAKGNQVTCNGSVHNRAPVGDHFQPVSGRYTLVQISESI